MKFVDNARKWYLMYSIQGLAVIGFLQGILIVLPGDKLQASIPFTAGFTWNDLCVTLTVTAAVLTGFGRLIDQGFNAKKDQP